MLLRRLGVLLELIGIFVIGTIAARLIIRSTGLPSGSLRDSEPGAQLDFLALAASTAVSLLLRYGIILGLAFLAGWIFHRRAPAAYGVTRASLSARTHLNIAVVLFAVGAFLPKLLIFARDHVNLGAAPSHWSLIASADSFAFWVYMAVGSFALVPLVEELFFRGYVQTRLGDGFGAAAAIAMTAMLFALSHRQYFLPSVIGAGMLLSLLFSALLAGYVRHRYGTLWPGVIAHALGNVPVRGWMTIVLLAGMIAIMIAARRAIVLHARELATLLRTRSIMTATLTAVAVIVVVLGIAAVAPSALLPIAIAAFVASIAIEVHLRRSAKTS